MSYYDDWVEPNAFFRGGSRLLCREERRHSSAERSERRRQRAYEERIAKRAQCAFAVVLGRFLWEYGR